MLRTVRTWWRWVLAIGVADEGGPDAVKFEVRRGARIVVRMLMAVSVWGYGVVAVAAVVGPGLSFSVRVLMFAVATGVGALQLIWLERRGIRACVVATPGGISVFNGLRTHFVPWSEVEGFEDSSRPFLLAIRRTKGRPLPMAGLTPGSFGNRAPQAESLEQLEGYWRRRTVMKVEMEDATSTVPPK
jgi:hypothetical protein